MFDLDGYPVVMYRFTIRSKTIAALTKELV